MASTGAGEAIRRSIGAFAARLKAEVDAAEDNSMGPDRRRTELDRERLFTTISTAFVKRDYQTIERAMRADVVLELPGSSPFAGEHRGLDSVGRYLLGVRQFARSNGTPITFRHSASSMTASHELTVTGPKHVVEMMTHVTLTFDEDGRISSILVEPDDIGLFDHVLMTAFSTAS